jgi:23S rRNA pseudouridine1911/1915/1917 synthase
MTKNNPQIIYRDSDITLVNKPYGMIVNRADTTKDEFTLQDWLENTLIGKRSTADESEFRKRGGIVHRLDKDTSGIIIIANNEAAFINLQTQFKNRSIKKIYNALVHGLVHPSEGMINIPIERNPFNRKRFGVFLGGREAVTEYETIGIFSIPQKTDKEYLTLLKVSPRTGRTHQIRVHLKHLGYPIVSDILYGGRKNVKKDLLFCPRMFLHAKKISFMHPKKNHDMSFEADMPEELSAVLMKLEKEPINCK